VPEPASVERAELRELDADFSKTINDDKTVKVQFNPETLKVTYANQIVQNNGAGDQRGSQTRQFVGAGTTKLSLQLWFDVTSYPEGMAPADDVRKLTAGVAYFITPRKLDSGSGSGGSAGSGQSQGPRYAPPAVRFMWGSFQFDGLVDQMEESLEFWSADGRPLRASVSLAMSQQQITFAFADRGGVGRGGFGLPAAGITPLAQATVGATLPGLAANAGAGASWQSIASANGIEDPLRIQAGTFIDLSARASGGLP
jgi:hypothetical protein